MDSPNRHILDCKRLVNAMLFCMRVAQIPDEQLPVSKRDTAVLIVSFQLACSTHLDQAQPPSSVLLLSSFPPLSHPP